MKSVVCVVLCVVVLRPSTASYAAHSSNTHSLPHSPSLPLSHSPSLNMSSCPVVGSVNGNVTVGQRGERAVGGHARRCDNKRPRADGGGWRGAVEGTSFITFNRFITREGVGALWKVRVPRDICRSRCALCGLLGIFGNQRQKDPTPFNLSTLIFECFPPFPPFPLNDQSSRSSCSSRSSRSSCSSCSSRSSCSSCTSCSCPCLRSLSHV